MIEDRLRHARTVVLGLLLVQFMLGMAVNLYVTLPKSHPGANAPEYFGGLAQGVPWSIAHGAWPLQLHALLGLLLVVGALVLIGLALAARHRGWVVSSIVGAFGIVGAGFNGGSFLNYGHDFSSMLMATGFAVAMAAYMWSMSFAASARAVRGRRSAA